jgi:hypothetical protein
MKEKRLHGFFFVRSFVHTGEEQVGSHDSYLPELYWSQIDTAQRHWKRRDVVRN